MDNSSLPTLDVVATASTTANNSYFGLAIGFRVLVVGVYHAICDWRGRDEETVNRNAVAIPTRILPELWLVGSVYSYPLQHHTPFTTPFDY